MAEPNQLNGIAHDDRTPCNRLLARPKLQRTVICDVREIGVRRQQCEIVADTQLRYQRVDRSALDTSPPAFGTQRSCGHMILTVRYQQWKRCESLDDLIARFRTGKSLQELLHDQPGGDDSIASFQGTRESLDLRAPRRPVSAQQQRPDTRIDEETQRRDLSFL
jgi:hypothetical protein